MPRAVDRYNPDPTGDPNRSGTEFHVADLAVGLVELLGEIIPQAIANMQQAIVDFIKETIGIDLSSPELFFISVIEFIQNGGPDLTPVLMELISAFIGLGPVSDLLVTLLGALDGIDLSNPGSILTAVGDAIEAALEDVPILGDIVEAITGVSGGGLPDLTSWAADVPGLGDIVEAITGVVGGGFPDLSDWSSLVPLKDIITGLLSGGIIPGLDASKIVTGIFTLSQLPGTVLNSITGVAGSLINSILGASFIPGLDASKITTGGFAQSIITGLTSRLVGLDTGIQGAVDGLVNSLLGLGSIGWGQGDANDALKAQAAATAANAAAIAALQSNADQGANGGQSFFHDFTIDPNGALPADFTVTYAGTGTSVAYGVASGQSDWDAIPATTGQYRTADVLYGGVTDSDYQLVGAVLTSTPGRGYIDFGAYPFTPHSYSQVRVPNAIRGRENAAGDTYIEALFGYDDATSPGSSLDPNNRLQLACVVSGSRTNWVTTTYTPKANTAYYLQCGTAGGLRIYRILEGGSLTPILTHTEVGTSSQLGTSYRRSGAFTKSNNSSGNGLTKSSPMSAFLLRDNLPATYIGSTGRAYRSTTTATRTYASTSLVPTEFDPGTFDTVGFITNDLSYNQGASEVHTVTIAGSPSSGPWTYTVGGQTATGLARNISTASLQLAIAALSSVGTGNVTITGTAGTSYVITYGAAKAGLAMPGSVTSAFNVGSASLARTVVGAPSGFTVSVKGNYVVSENTTRQTSGTTQQPCIFVNGVCRRRGTITDGRIQNTWVIPLEIGDRVSAGVATNGGSTGFQAQDVAGTDMVLEITGIPT